ncbi:hypothetical protein CEXT_249711 [Caerostris extrusa]|uniref:Uncharacterized protein n=1 Tax=Caerostris extrusa TaxID=172846 RepID=A0AAV4T7F9_CAEEX|nr:hypothetical protein CEXT_249711 [Caerostris extrusa]
MTRVGNHTQQQRPAVGAESRIRGQPQHVRGGQGRGRAHLQPADTEGSSASPCTRYAFVQYTDTWDARNAVVGEDGRTVAGQLLGEYTFTLIVLSKWT